VTHVPPRSRTSRAALMAGVALLLLGAGVAAARFWRSTALPHSPAALSVRPFSASGADRALGVGLSHAISARLGVQNRVSILTGETGDAPASTVSLVLDGEIIRSGDNISVIPRLVDSSGSTVWSDRLQVRADNLFSIENVVAERVVDALNLRLAAAEQDRLRRRYTSNAKAYEEYLRGRAEMIRYTPEGTASAIAAFESALREDHAFALARAGLAMACADMCLRFASARDVETWGLRAEAEAQAALVLDPHLAEAHLARAATARKREFDWSVVIDSSQRALVLDPNLPQAHFFKAAAFYHLGYMEEALLEVQKGRNLRGPDVVEPVRIEGVVALFSGEFAPARAHLEQMSRSSSQPIGDAYLALAVYYSGNAERGQTMLETLATNTSASTASRSSASLAGILAANGASAEAREHIHRVLAGDYRDHHVAYSLGVAYAQLGAFDAAKRWLRTAADTGFLCLPWYQRDPLLEPFRRRPEFTELLSHVRERREASTSSSVTP
jgi:adenylate cyclase